MTFKKLQKLIGLVHSHVRDLPVGFTLDGSNRTLNQAELITIANYQAVVHFLVSEGFLKDTPELNVNLLEVNSFPAEEDYLVTKGE